MKRKARKVTMDEAEEYFLDEWMYEQQLWAYWNVHRRCIPRDD